MKFKGKAKEYQLLVMAKAARGEVIDEKELDRFSRVFLRGFLRPRLVKKNVVEYTGPVGGSLAQKLKKPISKRDFLFIVEQVVVAVQKLQANKFGINNLVMDLQYVYMNEATKEVQFIYIPTFSGIPNKNLIEFLETIICSVKPIDEKDRDFVSRFTYFFKTLNPFDINMIEDYVANEDRSVVNTIRKQNAGQSGFITNKQRHYYEYYDKVKAAAEGATTVINEYAPTSVLIENEDLTTVLVESDDNKTTELISDETEATTLLNENENVSEGTVLLVENNYNVHFPTLYRILTGETISVNKPVFRVGKERSYVDYFVTNNIAVSRSHADIITRGNKYFVKDLNSKNHTYINDQEIPIHIEIEIRDGDRLVLGNEEFIFNA